MYCRAYNVLIKVINEYLLVHLTHHAEFSASSWSNFGVMVGHPWDSFSLLLIFYSLYSSALRYIYWFACMSLLRLFCHIPFLNVWKKGHLNLLNAYNVLLCISIFWVFNLFYIKTPCGMCLQDYGIDFDDHDHLVKFRCRCGSNFCRNMKRSSSKDL